MHDALIKSVSQGKLFAFLLAIFAGAAVHAAGDLDCSMAVPDELVKQISFRVDELRSVSNATSPHTVDI